MEVPVLSILIVDDDVSFGGTVKRVVAGMGHIVEQITDPHDIIDRYDEFAPDVIFLDIFMPDFDGIEVASWLSKKQFKGKVVFMSGHDPAIMTAARHIVELRGTATVATLEKPIRADEIRDLVNAWIDPLRSGTTRRH